jgi:5-carboxymethyl-2-hydroxymuconate isomerase
MPHIIVEYSNNLEAKINVPKLIDAVHQTVLRSGLFEPTAVRTRAAPRALYRIADGAPENVFLHIAARIRAGRTTAARKALGESLLRAARESLAVLPAASPVAVTVEVHEIDPEMLFRHTTIRPAST